MGEITAKSPLKILLLVFLPILFAVISVFYAMNLIVGQAYPINSSWSTPFARKALPTDFEGENNVRADFSDLSLHISFTPRLKIKDLQVRFTILDEDGEEILKIDKYVGDVRGQLPFEITFNLSDLGNVLELTKNLKKMDSCTFDVTRGTVSNVESLRKAMQDKAMSK